MVEEEKKAISNALKVLKRAICELDANLIYTIRGELTYVATTLEKLLQKAEKKNE